MQNFIKTILNAVQKWTTKEINKVKNSTEDSIKNSVADWNQNDVNANSYIKNRTHWEEENFTIIVPEHVLNGFSSMNNSAIYAATDVGYMDFVAGDKFIVTWDGINYDVEVFNLDGGNAIIGNEHYFNFETGGTIPFTIISTSDAPDGAVYIATESTDHSHTISISKRDAVIHKLDYKYLPDDIAPQFDWNQNDPEAKDYIKNRTHWTEGRCYLSETTLHLEASEYGYSYINIPKSDRIFMPELQFDVDYIVVWDGVEYIVRTWDDDYACVLGGYYSPFYICTNTDGNGNSYIYMCVSYTNAESAYHTFSIYGSDMVVHKIDPKYLPDDIVDLTDYATKEYVDTAIDSIDIPDIDLTGYATETYVQEQIDGIDIPKTDLSNYYTKSEVDAKIPEDVDLSNYALKTDIPSIEGLATEQYVDDAIANIDIPSGGSGGGSDGLVWKKVLDITVEEEVTTAYFDVAEILDQLEKATFMVIDFAAKAVSSADIIGTSPTGTFQWQTGGVTRTWVNAQKFLSVGTQWNGRLSLLREQYPNAFTRTSWKLENSGSNYTYNTDTNFGVLPGNSTQRFVVIANNTAIGAGSTFKIYIA